MNAKRLSLMCSVAMTGLVAMAIPAEAASLVSGQDPTASTTKILTDAGTILEFRDISETLNSSFSSYVPPSGFSVASLSQVSALFDAFFGIGELTNSEAFSFQSAGTVAQAELMATYVGSFPRGDMLGFTSQEGCLNPECRFGWIVPFRTVGNFTGFSMDSNIATGIWTVREVPENTSIPEPASILGLLTVGAITAGSTLRKKTSA